MNIENIKRVRDHIATVEARRFNMAQWADRLEDHEDGILGSADLIHDCQTCGCIGGWTEAMFGDGTRQESSQFAANALGLDHDAAEALFFPWGFGDAANWAEITQKQAVAVLDHLMAAGVVDWSVARGVA